ncbi:MAG: NADH-quinone oxidoreductase subunit J [Bacillaceae bacterium]
MNGELVAFFILAFLALGGAIFMINAQKVMHMMLLLVFTFLSLAGIYVLLEAEFVGVVQVLIYSGAITILMLFGIMLTKSQDKQVTKGNIWRRGALFVSIFAFFGVMYVAISNFVESNKPITEVQNNTAEIGKVLYSQYIIPFEILSLLLLVALVGAIVLAKREEGEDGDND